MKSSVIVNDGSTQIALTPETQWERTVLDQIRQHAGKLTVLSGNVFECQGGWTRVTNMGEDRRESSLILRLDALEQPLEPR